MSFSKSIFKNEERAMFELRQLYEQYGYARYKVSKFEEYDLYAHNKSFLVSEHILSFTDTNGKLMALKPDVTLSIVKNVREADENPKKVYYNETVYRTANGSDGFCEIMQTGLECIGNIDLYSMCEVLMLAKKSLALISREHILDISHMGLLRGILENAGVPEAEASALLREMGNKNLGAIRMLCDALQLNAADTENICTLTSIYEPLADGLARIAPMIKENTRAAYEELCEVSKMLSASGDADGVYLDFSMINDMSYYNGIIFRGYVKGLPDGVLSGGRYDSLLQKMGKHCGAIGFAVYLDSLSRLEGVNESFDTDVLVFYDDSSNFAQLFGEVSRLREGGKRVRVVRRATDGVRAAELLDMRGEGANRD